MSPHQTLPLGAALLAALPALPCEAPRRRRRGVSMGRRGVGVGAGCRGAAESLSCSGNELKEIMSVRIS